MRARAPPHFASPGACAAHSEAKPPGTPGARDNPAMSTTNPDLADTPASIRSAEQTALNMKGFTYAYPDNVDDPTIIAIGEKPPPPSPAPKPSITQRIVGALTGRAR